MEPALDSSTWSTNGQFTWDDDTGVGTVEAGKPVSLSSGDGVKTVSGAFEVRCTNWVPNELISVYWTPQRSTPTGPRPSPWAT